MAVKQRYTISLPDHITDVVEKRASAVSATPTEYAADIIRWWFGQGCPPVTPDEAELRQSKTFNVWKLDPNATYNLVDKPVELALRQIGMPNLFAQSAEHDIARFMVAFDNHPTHWLIFNFFKGGKNTEENGLAFLAYPKNSMSRDDVLLRLTVEAKKMESKHPIAFSQLPSKPSN